VLDQALALLLPFFIGIVAGTVGSLLGIGGGSIMTPLLVAAGYGIQEAVPASLLAIVGTSVGGLYVYEQENLVDYRLAALFLSATVLGSIIGITIAIVGGASVMKLILAIVLVYTGITMTMRVLRGQAEKAGGAETPARLLVGWAASILAGMVSVLAGVGGGILKVPIMNRVVGIEIKRAVATSKLMVGVTASSGVLGYYLMGALNPNLGLTLMAGTLIGGLAGSKLGVTVSSKTMTILFAAFLIVMSVVVILRG